MNAIKNTIVTVTLLIVGYGAYKVLKDPGPNSFDDDLMGWDATMDPAALEEPLADLSETETALTSHGNHGNNDLISRMRVPTGQPADTESTYSDAGHAQADYSQAGDAQTGNVASFGDSQPVDSYGSGNSEAESNTYDAQPQDNYSNYDAGESVNIENTNTGAANADTANLAFDNDNQFDAPSANENTAGQYADTNHQDHGDRQFIDDNASSTSRQVDSQFVSNGSASVDDSNQNFYDRSPENLTSQSNELIQGDSAADASNQTVVQGGNNVADSQTPASQNYFEQKWTLTKSYLEQEKLTEALATLSEIYEKGEYDSTQATRLFPMLDKLAGSVIYSADSYLESAYQVKANETIHDIAKQYRLSADFLARINGVAPDYQPVSGETLKVVRGPFDAVLDRSNSELTLFLGTHYAGRFSVKLGPELPSGAGNYQVTEKTPGREFFDKKTGMRVPAGDTDNPYGNYWIGLRGDQVTSAHNVGIHSLSSGKTGCIGVTPTDADDLNAILTVGSRIIVLE